MSQAKVDKYKEEKKNRAKTMKLKKIKKAVAALVVALGLGALIGIPLGKFIYNKQKEEAAKNATISSLEYDSWFDKEWAGKYADRFSANAADIIDQLNATASDADAEEEEAEEIEPDEGDIELEEE